MAEYYPLLARAIAGLPQSTPETRRAIYERARTALIGQLRVVQPPIAEQDIQRESRMLDEAIAQLEAEAAPPPVPASTTRMPPSPGELNRSLDSLPRRSDGPAVRPTIQTVRPALPGRQALVTRTSSKPAERPAGLGALDAARQRLASLAKPAVKTPVPPSVLMEPKPAPVEAKPQPKPQAQPKSQAQPTSQAQPQPAPQPAQPQPVWTPQPQPQPETTRVVQPPPETTRVAQPQVTRPAPTLQIPSPNGAENAGFAPQIPVDLSRMDAPLVEAPIPFTIDAEIGLERFVAEAGNERREQTAPINGTLRKYGPRAEAARVSADLSMLDDAVDEPRQGGVRPAAPLPPINKERNLRPWLIGLPVALVVAAIAIFAYMRRDNPDDLVRLRPAPGAEPAAEQTVGKLVERIGGGQVVPAAPAQPSTFGTAQPQPSQPSQQKPSQPQPQPQPQPQASQSVLPSIPVAQRAALLVDAPDDPQRVRTHVGTVVWRLDNVSRGPGQPLSVGVRAEVDLPDAKLKAVILIQKNADNTLPATHTIEVRFTPTEGGPIPGVATISTPQMRKEDTPAGDALVGAPAPILRNFFLVGLTRGESATIRNLDLIRNRGWIDIPMQLSDQRIAKLTFEKGTAGERVVNEALDAWK